jgi:hypothetical protein
VPQSEALSRFSLLSRRRWGAAALLFASSALSSACSKSTSRSPYASEDCEGSACSAVTGKGGGGVRTDAGASLGATDASLSSNSQNGGCFTDVSTGVTLCATSALCPGVDIDPANFPNCGFVPGATVEAGCLCPPGTELCPIGVGTSCTNLTTNLANANGISGICNQVSTNTCRDLTAQPSGSGGASGCNQDCLSQCSGSPGCAQLCGC